MKRVFSNHVVRKESAEKCDKKIGDEKVSVLTVSICMGKGLEGKR
jgi:hypothetical protein